MGDEPHDMLMTRNAIAFLMSFNFFFSLPITILQLKEVGGNKRIQQTKEGTEALYQTPPNKKRKKNITHYYSMQEGL